MIHIPCCIKSPFLENFSSGFLWLRDFLFRWLLSFRFLLGNFSTLFSFRFGLLLCSNIYIFFNCWYFLCSKLSSTLSNNSCYSIILLRIELLKN
jgi:hypothetical protein